MWKDILAYRLIRIRLIDTCSAQGHVLYARLSPWTMIRPWLSLVYAPCTRCHWVMSSVVYLQPRIYSQLGHVLPVPASFLTKHKLFMIASDWIINDRRNQSEMDVDCISATWHGYPNSLSRLTFAIIFLPVALVRVHRFWHFRPTWTPLFCH